MTATFFGFGPPFFGGAQGVLSRQEDERLIKNDLLQLLLTAPGERVFRPNFGTNIRPSLFEPMTDADIDALRTNIANQVDRFEPRVQLSDVVIEQDPDANTINIKLFGRFLLDQSALADDSSLLIQLDLLIGGANQIG